MEVEENPAPCAGHTDLGQGCAGNQGHNKDFVMFFSFLCFWNNPTLGWEADLTSSPC